VGEEGGRREERGGGGEEAVTLKEGKVGVTREREARKVAEKEDKKRGAALP